MSPASPAFLLSHISVPLNQPTHPPFFLHVFSIQFFFSHQLLPASLPAQIIIFSKTPTTIMVRWSRPRLRFSSSWAWKPSPTSLKNKDVLLPRVASQKGSTISFFNIEINSLLYFFIIFIFYFYEIHWLYKDDCN